MTSMKKNKDLSACAASELPDGSPYSIAIAVADWNAEVTHAMLEGATETLLKSGVKEENIITVHVPGSFELTSAAGMLLNYTSADAVICIGCVIQGETRHFEFIIHAVAGGIAQLCASQCRPVIFSVLTTNTPEQAKERAGGKCGNKGVEGAVTALRMCHLNDQLSSCKSKKSR